MVWSKPNRIEPGLELEERMQQSVLDTLRVSSVNVARFHLRQCNVKDYAMWRGCRNMQSIHSMYHVSIHRDNTVQLHMMCTWAFGSRTSCPV